MHDAEPPGPDLPPPHEPITGDAYTYRWPMGAEKVELDDGCPYFYGYFDHRDVEIAERAFPGRRAVIEPHIPDETRWGNLKIFPAPADRPRAGQRPSPAQELAEAAAGRGFDRFVRPRTWSSRGCSTPTNSWTSSSPSYVPSVGREPAMHEQLVAQLSERPYAEGSPWREDRVQLVDPNTQEVVCSLAYRDAVMLAFEIEQAAAQVLTSQWLREIMERHRKVVTPPGEPPADPRRAGGR